MKKILAIFGLLNLISLFFGLPSAKAENLVCSPGSLNGAPAINEIPTYSYQDNGLVQFNFKTTGMWFGNEIDYNFYNEDCSFKVNTYSPGLWNNAYPADTLEFSFKAVQVGPDSYQFEPINTKTGKYVGNFVGSLPGAFGPNDIISVGYLYYTGSKWWGTYNEVSVFTPAVPVKNPNFIQKKTPILIIPGTLGTEIWKGDEKLWMDIDRMVKYSDSFMNPLAFKDDGNPLDTSLELGDVLGKPHKDFDYTDLLVSKLAEAGYQNNKDIYRLPYDWRDDISKNAKDILKNTIDQITATSIKVDVIAHSQGGLLIKRLLYEEPAYSSKINKLIFVGTPHLGSPKTAKILLYGDDLGVRKLRVSLLNPQEIKKISQNMPAIYEMLPSKEYFNHSNGYLDTIVNGDINKYSGYEETQTALKKLNLNNNLIDSSAYFHTENYDNMDFSDTGIKTYNIIGCESGTIGKFVYSDLGGAIKINYVPGDGTVPLVSASNVYGVKNYFVLNTGDIHSLMLTQQDIRNKIINLIKDDNSSVTNITTNPALCVFKGRKVSVHSPVDLHIYDENGNHVGPNPDGTFDYQIDGVQYDIVGHEKFAFLPEGHNFTIKLVATDKGSFNFYSSMISGDDVTSTAFYHDVKIGPASKAEIDLSADNNQVIKLDVDGDGAIDKTIQPSSVLDINKSRDEISPVTNVELTGTQGENGFYRSDVAVKFNAIDPSEEGKDNEVSDVLATYCKVDGGDYKECTDGVNVESEGVHNISFYSVDKAGNEEQPKTTSFTIDKTAPEALIYIDTSNMSLKFEGKDNLSEPVDVKIEGSKVNLEDRAGNKTELNFVRKNQNHGLKFSLSSISQNGQLLKFSENQIFYNWNYDKTGGLKMLLQKVESGQNYATFEYNGKRTAISGAVSGQNIETSEPRLKILIIQTNKGNLEWK